jgi:tetraacyldisaccharide 4'-kinase
MQAPQFWNSRNLLAWLILPFSYLYRAAICFRFLLYRFQLKKTYRPMIPVIIVGNLTVGGTGKTPLVIWLANFLQARGFKPGIVSRGFKGKSALYPFVVSEKDSPEKVGDEALLLARHANCPLVIDPNRVNAAKKVMNLNCNVVISDDGLQHYALERNIEIVVVDGERRFGNGFCLPAGPLREPLSRLNTVDFVVANGCAKQNEFLMKLTPGNFQSLAQPGVTQTADYFQNKKIHAVAGIGNPSRFFATLRAMHLSIIEHAFPDHYFFKPEDLHFDEDSIIMMTEKDAVKCEKFADARYWYLPVQAEMSEAFGEKIMKRLKNL